MGENRYDKRDIIRREGALIAAGLKIASYRVRDPETDKFSPLQFHMTHDNYVMAVMSESAAKLFSDFVDRAVGGASKSELLAALDWLLNLYDAGEPIGGEAITRARAARDKARGTP